MSDYIVRATAANSQIRAFAQMQSYILEKAVMLENVNISFHVTGEEIEAECSARFQLTFVPGLGKNICRKEKLKRSYPPDDIRRLRAVKKMLGDS